MKKYVIEDSLLQAVGKYLSKQPYEEVAQLIALLTQLKEVEPPTDK